MEEHMKQKFFRTFVAALTLLVMTAVPSFAGTMPSKTAADQTIAERDASLSIIQEALETSGVGAALAAHGLSDQEITSRIAAMSDADLASLAGNIEQIQAAGLTRNQWIWIGVGARAALLIVAIA
jgi:hypothetical protein